MQEDPRQQKTKKAMYKIIGDKVVLIARDNRGVPMIIEEKI